MRMLCMFVGQEYCVCTAANFLPQRIVDTREKDAAGTQKQTIATSFPRNYTSAGRRLQFATSALIGYSKELRYPAVPSIGCDRKHVCLRILDVLW
ncbi:hypothetical protein BaRGS_00004807 [Batillaria attramentaria]|uniref:Uncharacterized protein n=1 Tax=Batillaria attramentaria TaxID=370345 RepID=A0ABD0LY27_9CAEN